MYIRFLHTQLLLCAQIKSAYWRLVVFFPISVVQAKPAKRGRGRPPGSKNKLKTAETESKRSKTEKTTVKNSKSHSVVIATAKRKSPSIRAAEKIARRARSVTSTPTVYLEHCN